MLHLTLEKLRAASKAGDVSGVTVSAIGSGFVIRVGTARGEGILTKARGQEPRIFGNPLLAMTLLREAGIHAGGFDLSGYNIDAPATRSRPDRSTAMKKAHQAAAYEKWFQSQVLASLDDPAESLEDDAVSVAFAAHRRALHHSLPLKD